MADGGAVAAPMPRIPSDTVDTAGRDGMRLRILATTDLHMHLLPNDYLTDRPCNRFGLARTASLIEHRRAEVAVSVLLDNGDFLQGSPMGDVAAKGIVSGPHPAIVAMNALRYDAAALGNHDFNYGLSFLRQAVAHARFPVLAANLATHRGPGFARWTILKRVLCDDLGGRHELRIGVIGFLPPQTPFWDQDLSHEISCADIVATARSLVPALQAEGAQIVIALAHSGIGATQASPGMEHAATALALVPGIDVIIAGHTHEVFPGPRARQGTGIDGRRGTLCGKPAVMPGYGGSHLGIIDLWLSPQADGALRITNFAVLCEPVEASLPAIPRVSAALARIDRATRSDLSKRIGVSAVPLTSHFALLGRDAGLRLIAQAQRWHLRRKMRQGTVARCWADLPILSAVAPFRAGGRGGPDHYTDIPAGPLRRRHLADLYTFPNRVAAICVTGSQLVEWLERSASVYTQLRPGDKDKPLLDPGFPGYNFDLIDAISWRIDLTQKPRYNADGSLRNPDARRVSALTFRGRPIDQRARFVVVTNSYRLAGCGLFAPLLSTAPVVLTGRTASRDVLRDYLRRRGHVAPCDTWGLRFTPIADCSALFTTARAALDRPLPSSLPLTPLHRDPDGFSRLRLDLSNP
ncbi:MAG: bifunctional 2',3'-cyclic-nucleotide 2'-phosphodiesterase/3'-nucleotidase [Paracoccus sp. (in: a-proteobacteria)]|nr:bifunctional 2',3'-cyclic-nucleotide 2'-phosphodiesterase/3'-nucleotidase [Paracoccus sp. (in: a-proteobacteria)]